MQLTDANRYVDHFRGSPGFFAPESVLTSYFDTTAADIFSCGCVALEMLLPQSFFENVWLAAYKDWKFAKTRNDKGEFYHQMRVAILSAHREVNGRYPDNLPVHEFVTSVIHIQPTLRPNVTSLLSMTWIHRANKGVACDDLNSHKPIHPTVTKQSLKYGSVGSSTKLGQRFQNCGVQYDAGGNTIKKLSYLPKSVHIPDQVKRVRQEEIIKNLETVDEKNSESGKIGCQQASHLSSEAMPSVIPTNQKPDTAILALSSQERADSRKVYPRRMSVLKTPSNLMTLPEIPASAESLIQPQHKLDVRFDNEENSENVDSMLPDILDQRDTEKSITSNVQRSQYLEGRRRASISIQVPINSIRGGSHTTNTEGKDSQSDTITPFEVVDSPPSVANNGAANTLASITIVKDNGLGMLGVNQEIRRKQSNVRRLSYLNVATSCSDRRKSSFLEEVNLKYDPSDRQNNASKNSDVDNINPIGSDVKENPELIAARVLSVVQGSAK